MRRTVDPGPLKKRLRPPAFFARPRAFRQPPLAEQQLLLEVLPLRFVEGLEESAAIAKGAQTFLRTLGTGILCGIRIFLWSLLLWIPGIIEAVRLYVALPVAVMENKGGNEAIARSHRLTDGSRWQLFGSWFLAFILPIGAIYLVTYLIVTAGVIPVSAFVWFEIGIALVFNAFAATLMAVCYFLLRQGKENVDAKTLAAVFD